MSVSPNEVINHTPMFAFGYKSEFLLLLQGSLASVVGLLMLPCVCRLTMELEANRPDGPKVAGSPANKSSPVNDKSPATESQPDLLRSQPGLQAPHGRRYNFKVVYCCQHSMLLCSVYNVALVPPELCQHKYLFH